MGVFRALVVAIVACGTAALTFAGNVEVTNFAAHDEMYGLVVSVDGKNDKAYVEDHHPDSEKTYRVAFWFHPGDMELAAKNAHVVFQAAGAHPDGNPEAVRILEIELKADAKNRLKVRAFSYFDDQSRTRKIASRSIRIDEKGWNHLLLEWKAASDNSSPDGFTRLSLIGGSRAGKSVEISGRVPDQRHALEIARMGVVRGVDATTYGSCYFDTFASYRTLGAQ